MTKSTSSFEESSVGWCRWGHLKVEDEKVIVDVVEDQKVGKIVVDVVMDDEVEGDVVEIDVVDVVRVEVAVGYELIDDHVRLGMYHQLDFGH